MKRVTKKVLSAIKSTGSITKDRIATFIDDTDPISTISNGFIGASSVVLPFLSLNELLKLMEQFTKSTATTYDKAMDAEYLRTHIGGGQHRMFDGGHDIFSAFSAVKGAKPDDTFIQETVAYVSSLWKDLTTSSGLPFVTWNKEYYEQTATWFTQHIPGATKDWFYDLCSFDALEIFTCGLGVAGLMFSLSSGQMKQFSELVGSLGIISLLSANALGGVALLVVIAYAIKKGKKIDMIEVTIGATLAGISTAIFSYFSLPILIELGIVLIVIYLLKKIIKEPDVIKAYYKKLFPSKDGPNNDIIYL